jgi:hypothetical protein
MFAMLVLFCDGYTSCQTAHDHRWRSQGDRWQDEKGSVLQHHNFEI